MPSRFNPSPSTPGLSLGPALSGLVIAYWGQEFTYLINAVSFLAVIVALIAMGAVQQQQAAVRSGLRAQPWRTCAEVCSSSAASRSSCPA